MTLKVTITHAQPGYDKDAIVAQSNGAPDTRITDGGSAEFYVYDGNQLTVTEAAKLPPENSPNGGGGPGEER